MATPPGSVVPAGGRLRRKKQGGGSPSDGGNESSPSTPAGGRGARSNRGTRSPLTTLPVNSPVMNSCDDLHSPTFGVNNHDSPQWWRLADGSPSLSDSVAYEQAEYLVRERDGERRV